MTSVSKIVYIDKQDDQVNKHNNRYHTTIKMEPVDEKCSIFIDFNKDSCKEDPKFKVRDPVRKSKYNKYFCKMLHSKLV